MSNLWYCYLFVRNFLLYNYQLVLSKKITIGKRTLFKQVTLLTGSGHIQIGSECVFGYKLGGFYRNGTVEFQARFKNSMVQIGNKVATNNNLFICAAKLVEIGDNSRIGANVTIMDHEAHSIAPEARSKVGEIGSVIIGKNVWIGNNVIILKNSVVGDNSIVAAGSVVNGHFPDNSIIGGIPAKFIKSVYS